jgi:cephalosporin hydroxylase
MAISKREAERTRRPARSVDGDGAVARITRSPAGRAAPGVPPRPLTYVPGPIPAPGWHRLYRIPVVARFLARHFHRSYYYRMSDTILSTSWLGTPVLKCPLDLWVYQELITHLRPGLIVELGTYRGGSALFFAQLCELLGTGRVITIDAVPAPVPEHERITYLTGSTVSSRSLARVRAEAGGNGPVLVVLDSNHTRDHVLAELRLYADLVTVGSYLIVEDTNINGHPVLPRSGPGPTEAVEAFLREDDRFEIDRSREKHLLTMHPGGFLKRMS